MIARGKLYIKAERRRRQRVKDFFIVGENHSFVFQSECSSCFGWGGSGGVDSGTSSTLSIISVLNWIWIHFATFHIHWKLMPTGELTERVEGGLPPTSQLSECMETTKNYLLHFAMRFLRCTCHKRNAIVNKNEVISCNVDGVDQTTTPKSQRRQGNMKFLYFRVCKYENYSNIILFDFKFQIIDDDINLLAIFVSQLET